MKKYSEKYKNWLLRKNIKVNKKKQKNNKKRNNSTHIRVKDQYGRFHKLKSIVKCFIAPSNFSLINNTEETIDYFNNIINYFRYSKHRFNTLYFDVRNVKYITIDAIMYLLAIIYNINNIKNNIVRVKGNLPIDDNIREIFIKSRFTKILENDEFNSLKGNKGILSGNDINSTVIGDIIQAMISHFNNPEKTNFSYLYNTLIELMENTISHAYINSYFMMNRWYLYIDYSNKISVTFVDTGLGIPETINKKYIENVSDFFLKNKNTHYILSALKGEYRTRTKAKYRGKGLPQIFQYYEENKIKKLKIISCKEKVDMDMKIDYSLNIKSYLKGTVFYWEID